MCAVYVSFDSPCLLCVRVCMRVYGHVSAVGCVRVLRQPLCCVCCVFLRQPLCCLLCLRLLCFCAVSAVFLHIPRAVTLVFYHSFSSMTRQEEVCV